MFAVIREKKIPYQMVPPEKLHRVSGKNHQGVIGFMPVITYYPLEELVSGIVEKGEIPLLVIADGITDVRNLGAVARSAECAGAHGLIIPERGVAPVNADAIKASAGALSVLKVCREPNVLQAMVFLAGCGLKLIACDDKAKRSIYDADLTGPMAIVMGSEDRGVSAAAMKTAHDAVSIPMQGRIASLNVSVAAGIVLFESQRQRLGKSDQIT